MRYYSYEDFKKDTNLVLKDLKLLDIDMIVAVARGGLIFAHSISEGLKIRNVQSIRTELYDDNKKREKITIYDNCNFKGVKNILVVDDISDSGETLDAIMKKFKNENQNLNFKTVTLFYKKSSCFEPDLWVNEATQWIEFFWEKDFLKD